MTKPIYEFIPEVSRITQHVQAILKTLKVEYHDLLHRHELVTERKISCFYLSLHYPYQTVAKILHLDEWMAKKYVECIVESIKENEFMRTIFENIKNNYDISNGKD